MRNVFVVGPDNKVKLILVYPMTTGRNFDEVLRVIDSLQLTAKHRVATPVNWKQGEDVIIVRRRLRRRGQGDLRRLAGAEALHPHRPPAELSGYAPASGDAASMNARRQAVSARPSASRRRSASSATAAASVVADHGEHLGLGQPDEGLRQLVLGRVDRLAPAARAAFAPAPSPSWASASPRAVIASDRSA